LFLNRFSFLFRLCRIDGFQAAQRDVGVSSQKGEKQDGASGLNFLCPLARFSLSHISLTLRLSLWLSLRLWLSLLLRLLRDWSFLDWTSVMT
jgi:hypothetical protein